MTTAGSDSGTAATTRLIAVITISSSGSPRARPRRARPHTAATATSGQRPADPGQPALQRGQRWTRCPSARRSGPARWPPRCAVTSARPRPRTTTVPADTQVAAALAVGGGLVHRRRTPRSARTRRPAARPSRAVAASAGTMSPSASSSTSPATRSAAGISRCSPSRSTRTTGAVSCGQGGDRAVGLDLLGDPAAVLTTITRMITAASVQSPVARVRTAAQQHQRPAGRAAARLPGATAGPGAGRAARSGRPRPAAPQPPRMTGPAPATARGPLGGWRRCPRARLLSRPAHPRVIPPTDHCTTRSVARHIHRPQHGAWSQPHRGRRRDGRAERPGRRYR